LKRRFGTLRAVAARAVIDNDEGLRVIKKMAEHDCPFCQSAKQLGIFEMRSLHNLVVVHEVADEFRRLSFNEQNKETGGALVHGD